MRFTRQFRHYLLGRKFCLRTDRVSLVWLFRFKIPEGQLARVLEELSQFDFVVEHRAGKRHANTDGISRLNVDEGGTCDCYSAGGDLRSLPCYDTGCTYCLKRHQQWEQFDTEVDYVVPLSTRVGEMRSVGVEPDSLLPGVRSLDGTRLQQQRDPDLAQLFQWLDKGRPPKEEVSLGNPALRKYWLTWSQITVKKGLLYYRWDDPGAPDRLCLMVPRSMQEDVLREHHDPPTAGHAKVERMLGLLQEHYHWYGIRKSVEDYVRGCEKCALNKHGNKRRAPLQTYHASMTMQRLHIDILGPFPLSTHGNRYILAVVDQFTNWTELFPLPDQTAETTARTLITEAVSRFGAPLSIHTDQGKDFESHLFSEVCRLLEVAKTRTTPYQPSSNSQVE